MTPITLSRATLKELAAEVGTPAYDPAQVRPGIVHLGFGNFHRAHMARYTHALMNLDRGALGWGILGAGLLASDERGVAALAPQDWLYTLVERDAASEAAQVIGSVSEVLSAANDTGPTLLPTPGVDIPAYKRQLIERFANPNIHDTVERVNTDATLNYLLDPMRDRLANQLPIDLLAFAVAAWLRRMRGDDEAGAPIDIRHPLAGLLRERAIEGGLDPLPMLRIQPVFGDLADNAPFVASVRGAFESIQISGVKQTLRHLV